MAARTHTHTHALYLRCLVSRLICPSSVYLSRCVCTQGTPLPSSPPLLPLCLLLPLFGKISGNPTPLHAAESITAVVFDVDCRRCCVYALSLHMYVCVSQWQHTHAIHTDTHTHTPNTHTWRCAHKWMNWSAAWWPVTINEPFTRIKRVPSAIDDYNNISTASSPKESHISNLRLQMKL